MNFQTPKRNRSTNHASNERIGNLVHVHFTNLSNGKLKLIPKMELELF